MQFANPLFLIALVSIAIPIAVHLFNFRRYKKVYFSNIDRLKSLQEETRRQSKLRSWLVLAARILALVFLVLAFAQPFVPLKGRITGIGKTVAVSVYIDNSFSMEQASTEGTLLECAKQKAREIAAAYAPSDQFQLVTNDLVGSQFRWLNRDDFLSALDEVVASPSTVMLSEVTRRQRQFLRMSSSGNLQAYQLSDFQQSTSDFSQCEEVTSDTLKPVYTTYIPFQASSVNNLYVDTIVFNSPSFYKGCDVRAAVRLRNMGTSDLEQAPVRMFVGGRQCALAAVDIPAGGTVEVPMSFKVDEVGVIEGYVETSDYPITFDDTLFFSFNVAPQLTVLDIYGKSPNGYLQRLYGLDSSVVFRSVGVSDAVAVLSEEAAASAGFDLVIVDEARTLPTHLIQTLSDYVSRGGTLLVVPSEESDRAAYNQLLGVLHAPLLGSFEKREAKVTSVDMGHPLYHQVFNGRQESVELPSVTGHFKTENTPQTLCQNVMTLTSGEGYLIACYPTSRQTSYLITTPLQSAYTDFVSQSIFVPTFYNMVLYSSLCPPLFYTLDATAAPVELPRNVFVSELLEMKQSNGTFSCVPHIQKQSDKWFFSPSGQVTSAGNYRFVRQHSDKASPFVERPSENEYGVAFNYSRRESQMQFYTASDIPQSDDAKVLGESKSVADAIDKAKSLIPLFLALALLMILAEVVLLRIIKVKS